MQGFGARSNRYRPLVWGALFGLAMAGSANASGYYVTFPNIVGIGIAEYPFVPNAPGVPIGSSSDVAPHDIALAGGYLYWLDGTSVYRSNPDGTGRTTFQTFGVAPQSLVIDVGHSNYYASFTGFGAADIDLYPLVPNASGMFIGSSGMVSPHELTLAGGQLYWLDGGGVFRSNLDGTGAATFNTFLQSPLSLAIDAANMDYYLSFSGLGAFDLDQFPLTPNALGSPIGQPTDLAPHDLTVAGGYLWWLDGASVYRSDLNGANRVLFNTFGITPIGLAVDAPAPPPPAVPEPGTLPLVFAGAMAMLWSAGRRRRRLATT